MADIAVRFPRKLQFLFRPARYKCARGGRGSGKSWGFARAILMRCASTPTRVLCTREVQKSIQQSVHQLLTDQIEAIGLSALFEVLQTEIRGRNGSKIYFAGLSEQTAESLKSYEGVDICWCEEAQAITDRSWRILDPTIRKAGSEIWITYNPELESDPTHQRFVVNPPPGCVSVELNYTDNPYFPETLDRVREHAESTMSAVDYAHVWLGRCRPAVEGAIYFEQMAKSIAAGRIRDVPHDGNLRTHVVLDLGMADAMTLILAQRVASEVRVIHYIEGRQRVLSDYSAELRNLRLDDQAITWGTVWLPHDGFHVRHQTGRDDASILRGLGWTVDRVPEDTIATGIDRARELFPRVYFHAVRAARLIECLKRYRWNISAKTGEARQPLHDEFSHGADAFRYLGLTADLMTNAKKSTTERPRVASWMG